MVSTVRKSQASMLAACARKKARHDECIRCGAGWRPASSSTLRTDVAPEQGLFSMAFHPNYAKNHRFYLDYTDDNGDTRVVEYRSNGFRAVRRLRQLLLVREPSARDPGGQLQFGPDGLLYFSVGDGRPEGYRGKQGQNLSTELSKLLRIDVDRRGARWQAIGYGLRFPWRFSFD